jgi:glucosamine kinase
MASSIIEDAAHELGLAFVAVKNRLDFFDNPVPLALGGGLLLHEASFRERVIHAIGKHVSIGTVTLVEEPALSGARAALIGRGNI